AYCIALIKPQASYIRTEPMLFGHFKNYIIEYFNILIIPSSIFIQIIHVIIIVVIHINISCIAKLMTGKKYIPYCFIVIGGSIAAHDCDLLNIITFLLQAFENQLQL